MGTDMKSEQTDCREEDIDVAYELLVTVTQKYKLRSSKDGTTNITWRIIYVCYFIVKFNIAVPKEFILNMIIFPEMFLRKINEKNADGEACNLENYICKNLSEHEIIVQIRKIAEKQNLWGTLAVRLIDWCDNYVVVIAKVMAVLVFDQLNTVCRNTDNRKVKGYCNNMILDIEKQYYEQLDIPWENGEIMKFVG